MTRTRPKGKGTTRAVAGDVVEAVATPEKRRRPASPKANAAKKAIADAVLATSEGLIAVAPEPAQPVVRIGQGIADVQLIDADAPPARRPSSVLPSRRLRRHRQDAGLSALLPPADIPEDAEGRIIYIAMTPLPDVVAGIDVEELVAEEVSEATEALGPVGTVITAVTHRPIELFMRGGLAGWAPIGLLAITFVVVFAVGMHFAK